MFVLTKGNVTEARKITEFVGRRTLHYLQRKFDVPIHHFYHPLKAPQLPDESVQ